MNAWLPFAIATGLLFGVQTIFIKKLSVSYSQHMVMAAVFLIAAIIFTPFLIRFSISNIPAFFLWTGLSFIINIFAFSLLYLALKNAPVSLVAPFFNLTPVFVIFTGIIVLNEQLSSKQVTGIVVIFMGAIMLQLPELRDAFKRGVVNKSLKSVLLALLVSFLWSFTAPMEKKALLAGNSISYGFVINLLLGLYFGGRVVMAKKEKLTPIIQQPRLLMVGVVTGAMALVQYQAILLQKVGPVIAYKRAGVILSIGYGILILKEKAGYYRILGAMGIIAGGFILA